MENKVLKYATTLLQLTVQSRSLRSSCAASTSSQIHSSSLAWVRAPTAAGRTEHLHARRGRGPWARCSSHDESSSGHGGHRSQCDRGRACGASCAPAAKRILTRGARDGRLELSLLFEDWECALTRMRPSSARRDRWWWAGETIALGFRSM